MKLLAFFFTLLLSLNSSAMAASGDDKQAAPVKIALALGGGGAARGAAHIGVLRVLEQEKIPVDYIVGTSMGAIIGGTYACGVPLDKITKMMHDKSLLRAYDTVPIPVRVALEPFFALIHLFGSNPYDGLYRGNKFANFINKFVGVEGNSLANAKIPFWAICVDLISGKVVTIKSGNIGRAIQASSAIPFLRRPVPIENALLVDGGVLANVPSLEARQTGADLVIAVDVDEPIIKIDGDMFRKAGSVPNRTLSLLLDAMDSERTKAADLTLRPDVSGICLLSTNVKEADRAIKAGEEIARRSLPRIRELISSGNLAKQ